MLQVVISLAGLAVAAPAPEDTAAPVVLPYGFGYGVLPYAGLPYATPLVYRLANMLY